MGSRTLRLCTVFCALGAGVVVAGVSPPPGQWRLYGSDTVQGDEFGFANDVDGDTAVVGAPYADSAGVGFRSGEAYVFVRSGASWSEQRKLLPFDPVANAQFGSSAAVSGDTAIVSAVNDAQVAAAAGAAYVFTRSSSTWSQSAKLTASDGAAGDNFGESVALDGNTAVIGARYADAKGLDSGAAWVFTGSGANWNQQDKLVANDGAAGDFFGISVAVDGDTAVVGAPSGGPADGGAAYVFVRAGGNWTQQQKLTPSGADQGFGFHVAISGNTVFVGAPDRDTGVVDPGAAYVFVRSSGTWTEEQRITAPDSGPHDRFGRFVAVSGDAAIIGSPLNDQAGLDAGAVYVFTRAGSAWTQFKKITATDADPGAKFGLFVAMSGVTGIAGAPLHDDPEEDAGSSYLLENVTGVPAPPDPNDPIDTFLLPQTIAIKGSTLTMNGVLDTGTASANLASAARLDIGTLDIVIPGLTRRGRVFRYAGNGATFSITQSAAGSSKANFKLRFTGDVSGIPFDGPVTVHFRDASIDGQAVVQMSAGKFVRGKVPGTVTAPSLVVLKANAVVRGAGLDSLALVVGFATDGVPPPVLPDVTIGFGTLDVTVPGASFTRSGNAFTFVGNVSGVTKVVLDYSKGTVTVTAKNATLGTFSTGANQVPISLGVGVDERSVTVRLSMRGRTLKY